MVLDDKALIGRAMAREADAEALLFAALYKLARKHVGFSVRSKTLAEEIVQESLLAIHKALPKFRQESSCRTWALTIINRTLWRLRKKVRRQWQGSVDADDAAPQLCPPENTSPEDWALAERLHRAVRALPPKLRDVFILMDVQGLTAKEAAAVLGIFVATAQSRNRLAKEALREAFQKKTAAEKKF